MITQFIGARSLSICKAECLATSSQTFPHSAFRGVHYSSTSVVEKVHLTLTCLLYNHQRKCQQNQHNSQHTTHNTQHTTHNTQHTTRWTAIALPSSGLLPSISKGTSTIPPTHCVIDNYVSVNGAVRQVHSGHSLFPCFGRHNGTHQKIERWIGPQPHLAAVWSKNTTTNRKLVEMIVGIV